MIEYKIREPFLLVDADVAFSPLSCIPQCLRNLHGKREKLACLLLGGANSWAYDRDDGE